MEAEAWVRHMNFPTHLLTIDGDHRWIHLECQGDENSDCWQFEDEVNGIKKGQECYIAFVFNEGYGRIRYSIEVPIELEGWDDDGLWAHLTGRPIIVDRKVILDRRGVFTKKGVLAKQPPEEKIRRQLRRQRGRNE